MRGAIIGSIGVPGLELIVFAGTKLKTGMFNDLSVLGLKKYFNFMVEKKYT